MHYKRMIYTEAQQPKPVADPEISKRGGHRSHAIHTVDSGCAHETSRAVRLGMKRGGHVPLVPYAGSATANNSLSATATQYAGPQTNRLTVKVAVKAAKVASPSTGSLFARRRTPRCPDSRPLRMLS